MRIREELSVFFILVVLLFWAGNVFSANSDYIIAIVNDDIITQSELDGNLSFVYLQMSSQLQSEELENEFNKYKEEALLRMIEDKLILQEAKQIGLEAKEDIVRKRIDEVKSGFSSQEEFKSFISSHGLTLKDIKERFRNEILTKAIIDIEVRNKISVHPQEITDYYNKNIDEFKEGERLDVDFVSAPIGEKEDFKKDVEELKDFEALAKKYNQAQRNVIVEKGEFRKDIEDLIYNLEIGGITPPVEIDSNIYVFRLIRKIESSIKPLSDVENYIYSKLMDMKMHQRLTEWLNELKDKSYIIIK